MGERTDTRIIDIENWNRKEQFNFFRHYDNPFFGFTADIDVTDLLSYTQARGYSFFAAYLFASQIQVNLIPEFRYRIKEDEVVEYSRISAGSTVMKANNVFTFCYFEYSPLFKTFQRHVLERIKNCTQPDALLVDNVHDIAQIHYSVIPWVHFSSVTHPRNYGTDDSVPKIVFGKYSQKSGRNIMPVSVEAHHALMDGFHIGQYFEGLQRSMDKPEQLLEG